MANQYEEKSQDEAQIEILCSLKCALRKQHIQHTGAVRQCKPMECEYADRATQEPQPRTATYRAYAFSRAAREI